MFWHCIASIDLGTVVSIDLECAVSVDLTHGQFNHFSAHVFSCGICFGFVQFRNYTSQYRVQIYLHMSMLRLLRLIFKNCFTYWYVCV